MSIWLTTFICQVRVLSGKSLKIECCHIFQKRGCSHGGIKLIISLFLCQWGQFNKKLSVAARLKPSILWTWVNCSTTVLPLWSLKCTLRCFLPLVPLAARLKLSNLRLEINCSTTVLTLSLLKNFTLLSFFCLQGQQWLTSNPPILDTSQMLYHFATTTRH